jgi:hypothetical protein
LGVYSSTLVTKPESVARSRSPKPRTVVEPPAPNCSPGTSASPVAWPFSSTRVCQSPAITFEIAAEKRSMV